MKDSRVQLLNPLLDRWMLVSTVTGRIIATKRTPGPYKNVPQR